MFSFIASGAKKATHLSEAVSHDMDNAVAIAAKATTTQPSSGVLSAEYKKDIRTWIDHSYEFHLSASGDTPKIRKQKQIAYTREKLEGRFLKPKSSRLPVEEPTLRSSLDGQNVTSSHTPASRDGSTDLRTDTTPSSPTQEAFEAEKKGNRLVYGVLGGFFGLSVLLAALAPVMNGKSSQNPEHQE